MCFLSDYAALLTWTYLVGWNGLSMMFGDALRLVLQRVLIFERIFYCL